MQNYIVYLAVNKDQVNKCRYALLKYLSVYNLKPPADIATIIYTDQPAAFEVFASFFHRFEMRHSGEISKLNLLKQVVNEGGKVIYIAPDAYPAKPLDELFNRLNAGNYYLYTADKKNHPLTGTPFIRGLKSAEQEDNFTNELFNKSINVIGLENAQSIIAQIEATLKSINNQVPEAEDVAINFVLRQKPSIAFDGFESYNDLNEFKNLLQTFFKRNEEESIPNLVKLSHHLDAKQIRQQKQEFEKQPFFKKWMDKLTGKGWSISNYEKKI
jgi:hypothetical protein